MRIERLNDNKIKVFLTIDDLTERGLTKEDIWKDSLKWHQLFYDMLEEASSEFGVSFEGSVAVEIFSLQAQGMIMIVTMEEGDGDEESLHDTFYDMAVTTKDFEDILFEFENIEHVIQLSKQLLTKDISGGNLYSLHDRYYLYFQGEITSNTKDIIAIMAEYGSISLMSIHYLMEYGNEIIQDCAIETLVKYFISD